MQYLGGKHRVRKQLAAIMRYDLQRSKSKVYVEPFCGSAWVAGELPEFDRELSDIHPQLISMWRALQAGWKPPMSVSPWKYRAAQFGHADAATTGFIGFAHSFAGRYFQGMARDVRRVDLQAQVAAGVLRRIKDLQTANFSCCSYDQLEIKRGAVVYCDPPYLGTKGYHGTPTFEHDKFWDWVRKISKGRAVYVSEYTAPEDFEKVAGFFVNLEMRAEGNRYESVGEREPRIERLWRLK